MDIKDEAEAMDVVRNEANPHHAAAFDESHPDHGNVRAALDTWFARANPQLSKSIEDDLSFARAGNPQAEPAQADAASGVETPAEIAADGILRSEWGSEYEANIQAGTRALEGIFSTQEQLDAYVRRSGILNDAEMLGDVMRLLAKLGKARR